MSIVYGVCAVVGGTVLVVQFVMTMLGISGLDDVDLPHDADVPHDFGHVGGGDHHAGDADHTHEHGHGTNWLFSIITFRTVVAALAFFGLAGLASGASGFSAPITLGTALLFGFAAMYGVHSIMQGFRKLNADGTVRIEGAVGKIGTVYLRIPANHAGSGKVTVSVQNRSLEFLAVTPGDTIPTGAKIVVTAVAGNDTLEVEPAPVAETTEAA